MRNCLENYQSHTTEIMSIQKHLSNINETNFEPTVNFIKSSKFYQNKESMKILIKSICVFIKIRRKQIHIIFKLIDVLLPTIQSNFNKEEIMSLFKRKEIHLKFLKDNIITIEDVASFYGIKNLNLAFFYPEIQALKSQYPTYIQELKTASKYKHIIDYFSQNENENTTIEDDIRLQTGNYDRLSITIQKDEIETFQSILSKNNIDFRREKIVLLFTEMNKCLKNDKIYLLEYAAFHGSLKIFKFLLLNESSFSNFFLKYAVCGGNNEIIHMAENAISHSSIEQDMNEILALSIIFHRYELSEYLIETYGIKIGNKDFLMSIYFSNYFFFINHITEFEDEYNNLLQIKSASYSSASENYKLKEMKNKAGEQILISAGNSDIFFLKTLTNLNKINFNKSGQNGSKENQPMISPLVYAIQSQNNENAKYLLSLKSVFPDFRLGSNMSSFLFACYTGNLEIVEYLVNNFFLNPQNSSRSINILRITDKSGENALHLATREDQFDVVKYLVSLNLFDLQQKSTQGETALEIAARLGYKEIFEFLKSTEIKKGIAVDESLKCNEERFLPLKHVKPLLMGFLIFDNLKEPISLCLLI